MSVRGVRPLQITILYDNKMFRPAGCRMPLVGERYVSKDGHIKRFTQECDKPEGDRLIVRELPPVKN